MTNSNANQALVSRYSKQTKITDPGLLHALYEGLPADIAGLVNVMHNLFLHIHWAKRYGVTPTEEQQKHAGVRLVSRTLEIMKGLDPASFTVARPYDKRFYGNCRDHSTFLVSILRQRGIPARARCGFGTYFQPGHYEDHWIVEHWDGERWVVTDAQLDEMQKERLEVDFDTLDMPKGKFVNASEAWLKCRAGEWDANNFGIFDMRGLWFIAGNLMREIAAFNDAEMLPWDDWGLMSRLVPLDESGQMTTTGTVRIPEDVLTLLDKVAHALVNEDEAEIVRLYNDEPGLKVPEEKMVAGV